RRDVRAALHLTTGLAGRIRTAREKRVGLSGCCVCGQDFAVHLVCRYVQEALQPRAPARSLQKCVRAEYVCLNEGARLHQRAVDMGLCREVHHVVSFWHQLRDESRITDVTLHEAVSFVAAHITQIFRIARVSELIEVDYARTGVFSEEVEDEVAAYEPAAAGD